MALNFVKILVVSTSLFVPADLVTDAFISAVKKINETAYGESFQLSDQEEEEFMKVWNSSRIWSLS
jgi:hypothetical protein